MSKADQLGAGRFGGSARPISARRAAVAAATGVPTDGVAPPTELPPHRVSLNPDNPRSSLGDLTDLAGSLKTHGQKQAITVMNRDAYVKANPAHEEGLEADTTYVVIDGSSRLAAARDAGLDNIKVMVSDDLGANSEELLESALVANIHRQDLDELDEARALNRLLVIHGSQTALAKRLHRSQGWVSQRLALLNLTPELQARIGEEPIDLLRAVGNKPAEQQQDVLEDLKSERARKEIERHEWKVQKDEPKDEPKAQKKAQKKEEPDAQTEDRDDAGSDDYYDVIEDEASPDAGGGVPAVEETPPRRRETVPEPRTDEAGGLADAEVVDSRVPPKLPYDDGAFLAMHLIRKMSDIEFDKMLRILTEHQQQRAGVGSASEGEGEGQRL
ncbi:ParB/RepB/Spo0J family partition protein [Streptomyces sp. GESEQ-35]|uniref:ParB/RepB/Spo0J family partition protein n=1 Tax=Streptomyces sp. GESEQ-35 TaxID=2812657 RepID=UPI001B33D9BA|nr:ParB/RepB/Spo0J family partition protein [Streptomyces sp. GESEQ-35]